MEETKAAKTKMDVKSSVEINNSPERKLQPLTAAAKSTPVSQRHDNDSYWDSFPAGYRFCPFDSELIIYYLKKKIMNERLPPNRINDVNLYQFNPHDLAEMYKGCAENEKEFYFFTPRDRKYKNGTRPNRAAGEGYWKATGADKSIKHNGAIVGFKKTLVFYEGKPPKGDKTFWIMHEYRVNNDPPPRTRTRLSTDMRLDDWVLCRIYYKERADKSLKSLHRKEERASTEETNEPDCDGSSVVDFSGYADTYSGFMQHLWLQQNAFSQIPSFKDVSFDSIVNLDEPFQHDGTSTFSPVCTTNDIFWSAYNQDNICFDQSQLDFSNRFEDNIIVKSNNSHN